MRRVGDMLGEEREPDTGALILGSKTTGCIFCGAEPVPTYSVCGRVVWWHPPTDCCDRRRNAQVGPNRRAARDYEASNVRSS